MRKLGEMNCFGIKSANEKSQPCRSVKKILNYLLDEDYNHIGYVIMDEDEKIKEIYFHDNKLELSTISKVDSAKWLRKITKPSSVQNRDIIEAVSLSSEVVLYHGNKNKDLMPVFGKGRYDNDYGQGFYTTADKNLGMEWAYSRFTKGETGYLHSYHYSMNGLNVLDLTTLDSMHWLAELLANRQIDLSEDVDGFLQDTVNDVLKYYKIDSSFYDVIIGYRADDSYFSYAMDFISGLIAKETLDSAFHLGNLGLQVFIKSEKAFERLHSSKHFCEEVNPRYANFYAKRDSNARKDYASMKRNPARVKHRVTDILREAEEFERSLL